MEKDQRSFVKKYLDGYLDGLTEKRSAQFIRQYAWDDNNQCDPALAYRIKREVHRRAAMSKELDWEEPLRWIGLSTALSFAAGIAVKATTEKNFSRPALITLSATTALNSIIQLIRLPLRYDAALKGGLDTARSMHEFDIEHHGKEAVDALIKRLGDDPWVKRVSDTNGQQLGR